MFRSGSIGILTACLASGVMLSACETTSSQRSPQPKAQNTQQATAVMSMLSKLDGEWVLANPTEEMPEGKSVFQVSSAGSVVREVMVPGTPYEMTNLYHMDGDDIVCTHYCAAGNQPRMVASGVSSVDGKPALNFEMDSVSNFVEGQDHYMGGLRVVFESDDRIRQEWTSFDAQGEVANTMTFVMERAN